VLLRASALRDRTCHHPVFLRNESRLFVACQRRGVLLLALVSRVLLLVSATATHGEERRAAADNKASLLRWVGKAQSIF
jgi:hypothetical protein